MKTQFDIQQLTQGMPYRAPESKFFEQFSSNLAQEIALRRRKKIMLWRSAVAAAVVVFGVVLGVNNFENQQKISSLDKFLVSLSDEDLNTLITDSEYIDEFYTNL